MVSKLFKIGDHVRFRNGLLNGKACRVEKVDVYAQTCQLSAETGEVFNGVVMDELEAVTTEPKGAPSSLPETLPAGTSGTIVTTWVFVDGGKLDGDSYLGRLKRPDGSSLHDGKMRTEFVDWDSYHRALVKQTISTPHAADEGPLKAGDRVRCVSLPSDWDDQSRIGRVATLLCETGAALTWKVEFDDGGGWDNWAIGPSMTIVERLAPSANPASAEHYVGECEQCEDRQVLRHSKLYGGMLCGECTDRVNRDPADSDPYTAHRLKGEPTPGAVDVANADRYYKPRGESEDWVRAAIRLQERRRRHVAQLRAELDRPHPAAFPEGAWEDSEACEP